MLYGTTSSGGSACGYYGCGTIFSMTLQGVEKVLYSFEGGNDGAHPDGSGIINVAGNFYGTTGAGGGSGCGGNGCGTVFELTDTGTETVLHSFGGGNDGAYPNGGLIKVKGAFYGTTSAGGANGCGTVFKVTPGGVESILYAFKCGSDGAYPEAGLISIGQELYGTTYNGGAGCGDVGCGTVFEVNQSGSESVLYSFEAGGDGCCPSARLVSFDGRLYGTTEGGGSSDAGTVFSLIP